MNAATMPSFLWNLMAQYEATTAAATCDEGNALPCEEKFWRITRTHAAGP